jgi:hypothetical protein
MQLRNGSDALAIELEAKAATVEERDAELDLAGEKIVMLQKMIRRLDPATAELAGAASQ